MVLLRIDVFDLLGFVMKKNFVRVITLVLLIRELDPRWC